MDMSGPRFAFLPPEEAPGELFELTDADGKAADGDIAFRDELFESISEAHYLLPPALESHEDALLESLVEKGCEDNQILDRLSAQLSSAADYEQALLADTPVADIIGRLESLESPSRSAAQGLLHLRHRPARAPGAVDPFVPDEVFAPEPPASTPPDSERRLRNDGAPAAVMYTEQMPDLPDAFDYNDYEEIGSAAESRQNEVPITSSEKEPPATTDPPDEIETKLLNDENDLRDIKLDCLDENMEEIDFKLSLEELEGLKKEAPKEDIEKPTDLSVVLEIDAEEAPAPSSRLPTPLPESLSFTEVSESEPADKSDDLPKDLSMHRRASPARSYASPRRIDIPRAPSRESDAMQSPQPSGIPAISSPEVFNAPTSKACRPSPFLESLYASTSPKMYTSEVTIQQCVPLNLGKHRKSASPTVSSCSDDIRNVSKEPGEPQEKRVRRESHDLAKICNLLKKCGENKLAEAKQKKKLSEIEQLSPLQQLELLKSNKNFNLPDHMLVHRDRLNNIIAAPGKEIPALLMERPQLNMAEILQDPNFIGDPELMVISLEQIRQLIIHDQPQSKPQNEKSRRPSEAEQGTREGGGKEAVSARHPAKHAEHAKPTSTERTTPGAPPIADAPHARPVPGMAHLADDIDAANTAAAYQMNWLPAMYMHQLEAVAACSQNAEFLKALGSAGYAGAGYAGLSQMFHPARFAGMPAAPVLQPPELDGRMQLAMWQEAMSAMQRQKQHAGAKDAAELAGLYAHLGKGATGAKHAARTPPLGAGYGTRLPPPQGIFPPPMSFYAPRAPPPRSPPSPFANNNYLQSAKQAEPRPRISVKSLQELQQTAQAASASALAQGAARHGSQPHGAAARRRDEEVGSTTSAGEAPPQLPHLPMPPHPHDPHAYSLWHPLFSNQKDYTSPWSWTTVTATGD